MSANNANAATVDDAAELAISDAEKNIAKILALLETQTGMIVDDIGVHDIEITTLLDKRAELVRRVTIYMKRLPGTKWDQ